MTPDKAERQLIMQKAEFLLKNINKLYKQQTVYGGIPYATKRLKGVQTTLESVIPSETMRAMFGISQQPDQIMSFIGVSERGYTQARRDAGGITSVTGAATAAETRVSPDRDLLTTQNAVGPDKVSPSRTFVFDADPSARTDNRIIHPGVKIGIQPSEYPDNPTLSNQIRKDIKGLLTWIEQQLQKSITYSPEAVADWKGNFLTDPSLTANVKDIPGAQTLHPDIEYPAKILNGQLVVDFVRQISLKRLPQIGKEYSDKIFKMSIRDGKVYIVPVYSKHEAKKYGKYSYETKRLFFDYKAEPIVIDLADLPELQNYPVNVVFTATTDDQFRNFRITIPQKQIMVDGTLLDKAGINAPNGTKFTVKVDAKGKFAATENVGLASIFSNPWTPNISPKMLPQFMAGLKKTGHNQLYVDTRQLVDGRKIHNMDSRVYYSTLIQLAHRYGIEVHAIQGMPDWATMAGLSDARTYLATLGRAGLDFDGFVLDIQATKLPQWKEADLNERIRIAKFYSNAIQQLQQTISYYAGKSADIRVLTSFELQSTSGYKQVDGVSDIIMTNATTVDGIISQIETYAPTSPFEVSIEMSLITDSQHSFAMHEDKMAEVLRQVTAKIRENPAIGKYFNGFVLSQDTGEDILHVMKYNKGRDIGERLRDSIYTAGDKTMDVTTKLYEIIISGGDIGVIRMGEEYPTSKEVMINTALSRLEAMGRGVTGAANFDNMVRSGIETIKRDRVTILPEAFPLGAEFGTGVAGATMLYGQQFSEKGSITKVKIEGVDENGQVVAVWDDLINSRQPIRVAKDSKIVKLRVKATVQAGKFKEGKFPGYLIFLSHHPDNAGVVTEVSSDEIQLKSMESKEVEFDVPVSGEGVNNYGFLLMHGRKFSKSEAIVDDVGIGHDLKKISAWVHRHSDEFYQFYSSRVKTDTQLRLNRLGIETGIIDNQLIVDNFTLDQLDVSTADTQKFISSLLQSGIKELTLDGKTLLNLILDAKDKSVAKKRVIDFISALHRKNIDIKLMVGSQSWLKDGKLVKENVQGELYPIFRAKLPVNGFVVNLGDKTKDVNLVQLSVYTLDAGYGTMTGVDPAKMANITTSAQLSTNFQKAFTGSERSLQIPIRNFSDVYKILSQLPKPSNADLQKRASTITQEELERYITTGYYNLSPIERLLFDFSRIKRLPSVELGESAALVTLDSPTNIYVSSTGTPYISVNVKDIGDMDISMLTAIVELRNVHTGEYYQSALPVIFPKGFKDQIYIPVENLKSGQWRYDVSIVPESYARDRAFVPAMPVTEFGGTVKVGPHDVTVYPQQREIRDGVEILTRKIMFENFEFKIIEKSGKTPIVVIDGKSYELKEPLKGLVFELGPSKIRVNISKNKFNDWAVESAGEEVSITKFRNLEEVLTVGVPHKSKVFGHIQKGLPEIEVSDIGVQIDKPYISNTATDVQTLKFGQQYEIDGYKLTIRMAQADMVQIEIIDPEGNIIHKGLPTNSRQRTLMIGDTFLMIGSNSIGEAILVRPAYTMADFTFTVTNTQNATSPLTYIPEISFYHPLVGELSIAASQEYTVNPGETKTITMKVPVPVDYLTSEKARLIRVLNTANEGLSKYNKLMRRIELERAKGLISSTQLDRQLSREFLKLKAQLPGLIVQIQRIIKDVQARHLVAEFHLKGIVDLNARLANLKKLMLSLDKANERDIPYHLINVISEINNIKSDIASLSTQKMGYKVSIHDISNLLGEAVQARSVGIGGTASGKPNYVVRDILVEPITGKTEAQLVLQIGKAKYAEIINGVVTQSVIQETHDAYIYQLRDLHGSQQQYADLTRDIMRSKGYNIPSSKLAVDHAQQNIELAATDKQRAKTVDLTTMFYECINKIKVADMKGGRGYVVGYAETVVNGEKLIYDMSTEALAVFLSDLQNDDSLAVKSDASRFLKDLAQLFRLIEEDGVSVDDAVVIVKDFLKGSKPTEIKRAVSIVEQVMKDERLGKGDKTNRKKAAIIVMEIAKAKQVREYIKHVSFDRLWKAMDVQAKDARQKLTGAKLQKELQRIRAVKAYLNLILEHDKAVEYVDESKQAFDKGLDPLIQAVQARQAFQNTLGYFQIIIGLESSFKPYMGSIKDLIAKIEAAPTITQTDKSNLKTMLQDVQTRMKKFEQYMKERAIAIDGAQGTLKSRKIDLDRASKLYAELQDIQTGHKLFIDDQKQAAEELFVKWKQVIRSAPKPQAIASIKQVISVEAGNLKTNVLALQQDRTDLGYYEAKLLELAQQRTKKSVEFKKTKSDVRRALLRNQMMEMQTEIYKLTSERDFLKWHIPYLETQLEQTYSRITDMQGAVLSLGGQPDTKILDRQIAEITKVYQSAKINEANLSKAQNTLTSLERTLSERIDKLTKKYDYPQRLRNVSKSIPISTVIKKFHLIKDEEGYFNFLKTNGITEVYLDKGDVETNGKIDLEKLKRLGRVIQAAHNKGVKVKILITAESNWAKGQFTFFGLFDRRGTNRVQKVAEHFRLLQKHLFDYGVYVDGFALSMEPFGKNGKYDIGAYRAARNEIASQIVSESKDLQKSLKRKIAEEKKLGHYDRAAKMQEALKRISAYEFDVFESELTAGLIDSELQRKYGADGVNRRQERYKGRTILKSSDTGTEHIKTADTGLRSANHGIGIDWTGKSARGRQELLPVILEQILAYQKSSGSKVTSIFIDSDSSISLQQNLNALGAVPLSSLNLLQTKADIYQAYETQVSGYIVTLKSQLGHLKKIVEAEQDFQKKTKGVLDLIKTGVVFEMPESFLADQKQLEQLNKRIAVLEKKVTLGISKEKADSIAKELEQLYADISSNVRRLRISLGAILSPGGFMLSPWDMVSGKSMLAFDIMTPGSPVGVMFSYTSADGKQKQRDLLKDNTALRHRVQSMKKSAETFAQYVNQVKSMEYQLQNDRYDVSMLRKSIDIASRPDAQVKPIRLIIDGKPVVIQGSVISALKQVKELLRTIGGKYELAKRDRVALEDTYKALAEFAKKAGKPDPKQNFLTGVKPQDISEPAIDVVIRNRQIAENDYKRAVRGMKSSQHALEHAVLGTNIAKQELSNAVQNRETAKRNVKQWKSKTESAFVDMLTALAGKSVSKESLYMTELGEVGTTIRLVQGEKDLRKAYFEFETIFHRLFRLFNRNSLEQQFNESFGAFDPSVVRSGWGLDNIFGAGTPYIGEGGKAGATVAEGVGVIVKPPVSLSLYGGFIKLQWSYLNPKMLTLSVNLSPPEASIVGQAQYNMLMKQSQYILTQLVGEDRRENVKQASEHFERMLTQYQEHIEMLKWQEQMIVDATRNLERASYNLGQAKQFMKVSEMEMKLAKRNFSEKKGNLLAAQQSYEKVKRGGEDTVTPLERRGIMRPEKKPQVTPADTNTTLEKKPADMGDTYNKSLTANRILARVIYSLLGMIALIFGSEKMRDSLRRMKLAGVAKTRAKTEKGEEKKGLFAKLFKELNFGAVTVLEIGPWIGKRRVDLARRKSQFKRLNAIMRRFGMDSFPIASEDLKEQGSMIEMEKIGIKGPKGIAREEYDKLSRGQKMLYRTRLVARLTRDIYGKFLRTSSLRLAVLIGSTLLGLYVFPYISFPNTLVRWFLLLPALWGGTPVFNPILLSDPSLMFPAVFWVPFLAILPNLLYMIPMLFNVLVVLGKYTLFGSIGLSKYFLGKGVFAAKLLLTPFYVLGRGFVNTLRGKPFMPKLKNEDQDLYKKAKQWGVKYKIKGYQKIDKIPRAQLIANYQTYMKWSGKTYENSKAFAEKAISKARQWAKENGLGELEQMPKAEAEKIVHSFILEEAVRQSKYTLLQDEGNLLRVNVQKAVSAIETTPGVTAYLPAIFVPFYPPTKNNMDKWAPFIWIQNITQMLQYLASMLMRSFRGLERNANVIHPTFEHIISKSELGMASFAVDVQGRWLTGHINVIRPEMLGGRIALEVNLEDPREYTKKEREALESEFAGKRYNNVQEFIDDLTNRGVELGDVDPAIFTSDDVEVIVHGADEATADAIKSMMKTVLSITAGYYRALPDEGNPFYGPGENETHNNRLPTAEVMEDSDINALGTYTPTDGVFYARGYYFGALAYLLGGVEISGEDHNLKIKPTGRVAKYDFNLGGPGSKARNLNALLLVLQGHTFMKREVVRDADGNLNVKIHYQDIDKEYFPEAQEAYNESKSQVKERKSIFKRAWFDLINHYVTKIYDEKTGSVVPVDLGVKLGFQAYEGVKGIISKWKAMTLGMLIGIAPVSLFGLIQEPLNAAIQGYYDPVMVEKTAQFRMRDNRIIMNKMESQLKKYVMKKKFSIPADQMDADTILDFLFSHQTEYDLLSGETVNVQEKSFTFPKAGTLNSPIAQAQYAKQIYDMLQLVGVHIPYQIFEKHSDKLTDTYTSLKDFLIAVEKERLYLKRRAAGDPTITTWEKGLAEYGTALVNVQDYLDKMSSLFPVQSDLQNAIIYLSSSIGNIKGREIEISIMDNGIEEKTVYDERTVYQVGMYNRTSGEYSAAYNKIAGQLYNRSHDVDVERAGAIEKQLGDTGREAVIAYAQDKSQLQGTRSWCMVSMKGPEKIYHIKSTPKSVKNWQINELLADGLMRVVDQANAKGMPIERIIVHDGHGNAPGADPSTWHIIVVGESSKLNLGAVKGMINALKSDRKYGGRYDRLDIPLDNVSFVTQSNFEMIEQFRVHNLDGHDLENYDARLNDISKTASKLIKARLKGIGAILSSPFSWTKRMQAQANNLKKLTALDASGQPIPLLSDIQLRIVDKINVLEERRAKRNALIKRFIYFDSNQFLTSIISVPINFLFQNGLFGFAGAVTALFLTGGLSALIAVALAVLLAPFAVMNSVHWLRSLYYGFRLSSVNLDNVNLSQKLNVLDKGDLDEIYRRLGLEKGEEDKRGFQPLKALLENLKSGNNMFSESRGTMLGTSDSIRSASANGIYIAPTTVDEMYVTQPNLAETQTEADIADISGFQRFNVQNSGLEPAIEEINAQFAKQGALILQTLVQKAKENPEALMASINKYIEYRKMLEGVTDKAKDAFNYVTLEDIKALSNLSDDLLDRGYLSVKSKDVEIIGKLFGLNKKDALNTLSGFWSEAGWQVALGIPMFPGATKGRIPIGRRKGTLEDARDIPILSAILTFAEPPYLAALSGFNVLPTNADEFASALAEDTLFGIRNIFNPELQPDTPAISIHLLANLQSQYQRRKFGEESLQRSASFGKAVSMMHGMTHVFEHPFFTFGTDMQDKENWSLLVNNLFNASAFKNDEISYEGVGRGTGWLNYILFGYSLYGHLPKRVGPFPPGIPQVYKEFKALQALDEKMNGRVFKLIRWAQLNLKNPVANGLAPIDYQVLVSLAKSFDKVPNADRIIDEMLKNSARDYINRFDDSEQNIAIHTLLLGDELFGHNSIPSDISIPEGDLLASYSNLTKSSESFESSPELLNIESDLLEIYSQDEIAQLKKSLENLSEQDKINVLKRILYVTEKPAKKLSLKEIILELWHNRFAKPVPSRFINKVGIRKMLGKFVKWTVPVMAVSLWGWWAAIIPIVFFVTDSAGTFKGGHIRHALRYVFGGGAVYFYIMVNGFAFGAAPLFVLAGLLIGTQNIADITLELLDLFPIIATRFSNFFTDLSSTITKAYSLRNKIAGSKKFKKEIILDMLPMIGTQISNVDDFQKLFDERMLLMNLRRTFLTQLTKYYKGRQINIIKENLKKFSMIQQFQILQRIVTKVDSPRPSLLATFRYLTTTKPGEKIPYRERLISILRDNISQKAYKSILTSGVFIGLIALHLALFGVPTGIFASISLFMEVGGAILFGTQHFRAALASFFGAAVPMLYIAFVGLSAAIMPVLVIAFMAFTGYIIGGTLGIVIPNLPEFIGNTVKKAARFAASPFRMLRLNAKHNKNDKRELIFSIIPQLLKESDTSLEFIRKFDDLYVETLDSVDEVLPFDQADGISLSAQGPDNRPDEGGPSTPPSGGTPPTQTPPAGTSPADTVSPEDTSTPDAASDTAVDTDKGQPAPSIDKTTFDTEMGDVFHDMEIARNHSSHAAVAKYNSQYRERVESALRSYLENKKFNLLASDTDNEVSLFSLIDYLEQLGLIKVNRNDDGDFESFIGPLGVAPVISGSHNQFVLFLNSDGIKIPLSVFSYNKDSKDLQQVYSAAQMNEIYNSISEEIFNSIRRSGLPNHLFTDQWNLRDLIDSLNTQAANMENPKLAQKAKDALNDLRPFVMDFIQSSDSLIFIGDFIPQFADKAERIDSEKLIPFFDVQQQAGNKVYPVKVASKIDDKHYVITDKKGNSFTARLLTADELDFINTNLQGNWKNNEVLKSLFGIIDNSGLAILREPGIKTAQELHDISAELSKLVLSRSGGGLAEETLSSSQDLINEENILPLYKANDNSYFKDYSHIKRMIRLVNLIADEMDITDKEKQILTQAAMIHELGKIDIDEVQFKEAREVLLRETNNPFIRLEKIAEVFKAKGIAEIKALSPTLPKEERTARTDAIKAKYNGYINIYFKLYNHGKYAIHKLKTETGIEIPKDSPLFQIVTQHNQLVIDIDNPRVKLLSDILIAANILDSTQALSKHEYYGRLGASLTDRKFGLLPNLKRANKQGRISDKVYNTVVELLVIQENDELINLIAAARLGEAEISQTAENDAVAIKSEIKTYFENIQTDVDTKRKQLETESRGAKPSLDLSEPEIDTSAEDKPVSQEEIDTQAETVTEKIEPVSKASHEYTQDKVNNIFEHFSIINYLPMKEYLEYQMKHPETLPMPLSIYRNELFKPLRQNGQSPREIFKMLADIANKVGFSMSYVAQLQSILEKTHYVKRVTQDRDVVLLDLDTFGISRVETAANERYRTVLLQYINEMQRRYKEHNRTLKIVLFSEKMRTWEVKSLLGTLLASQFDQLYGSELLTTFSGDFKTRYNELIISLSNYYDVNRVNMKVFSNKSDIMDIAKGLGTILADRGAGILDALKIFANIHPDVSADIQVRNSAFTVSGLLAQKNEGYFSLAGEEFSLRKNVPAKLEHIGNQYLIDKAA
ncbi:hypothetical protein J7L67_09745 [bacterium]|nr:hypothetical protein [bacterium]